MIAKMMCAGFVAACASGLLAEDMARPISVNNVAMRQDRGTQKVHVTYDLSNDCDAPAYVVLDILTNGVSIGRANIQTLSGDVSDYGLSQAVAVGTGRQIVWDARTDWKGNISSNATAVVTAYYAEHLNQIPGVYMKIDLSGGASATSYPVSYSLNGPNLSDTASYAKNTLWLRRCEPGVFLMGSPANEVGHNTSGDETQHQVTLNDAFFLGVFEVTEGQYKQVMGECPTTRGDAYPAVQCGYNRLRGTTYSWPQSGAVDKDTFLYKLRVRTALANADLPTEAQWEYACRAGCTTGYYNGLDPTVKAGTDPNLTPIAWYNRVGCSGIQPVGGKLPNDWGFYDMLGNAYESVLDRFSGSISSYTIDPEGPEAGTERILRGGSWDTSPGWNRCAWRLSWSPAQNHASQGFRVCWTVR